MWSSRSKPQRSQSSAPTLNIFCYSSPHIPARPWHWRREKRDENDPKRPFITSFSAKDIRTRRAAYCANRIQEGTGEYPALPETAISTGRQSVRPVGVNRTTIRLYAPEQTLARRIASIAGIEGLRRWWRHFPGRRPELWVYCRDAVFKSIRRISTRNVTRGREDDGSQLLPLRASTSRSWLVLSIENCTRSPGHTVSE